MDTDELRAKHDEIRAEAESLAGALADIPRRVAVLYHLYLDSGRNHAFSQIAAHGALWAAGYFEAGGRLGRLIAHRYFYSRAEKAYRIGILTEFAEGFRRVNRQVCIDTYTNYHFARRHGREPNAAGVVPPNLLDALLRVHAAREAGRELDPAEKRRVFEQSFLCEQEVTVAPGVKAAVAGFECRVMKFLCLRPLVRFAYFPGWRFLFFRDFSEQSERIAKGLRAYDYAERVGWPKVRDAMRHYGVMSERFFREPQACFDEIRAGAPGTLPGH
jgi:hypothetical protein